MGAGMLGGHDVLQPIAHLVFVPLELAEELLQRPQCNIRLQGYGLDTLLGQIGELPTRVHTQMGARILYD